MRDFFPERGPRPPVEVDWRKVPGRVGPVKDQKGCGASWAFATTGVLEGQQAVRNISRHRVIPLSEQQLIECSGQNLGCDGGVMEYALEDVGSMGGLVSEQDWPYLGHTRNGCKWKKHKAKNVVMTAFGAARKFNNLDLELMRVVASYGPVAVAIDAPKTLVLYKSGVYDYGHCNSRPGDLIHAVLIVGYGTDLKLGDYWIVKNSWGSKWGENGYFRLRRGINLCGVRRIMNLVHF